MSVGSPLPQQGFLHSIRKMVLDSVSQQPLSATVGFGVSLEQILPLATPQEFYAQLLSQIKQARKHIFLSTLYLGTDVQERQLIREIDLSLSRNPELEVFLLMDRLRGTRKEKDSSSAELVHDLSTRHPHRVQASFFQTPNLVSPWDHILPPRINEVMGVQHIKTYIVDDSLIISGANLSKDYFTNRQDRYILFRETKNMADFFKRLYHTVAAFSFRHSSDGHYQLGGSSGDRFPHPARQSGEFTQRAAALMSDFIRMEVDLGLMKRGGWIDDSTAGCDASVVPILQMGSFGVNQEKQLLQWIFDGSLFQSASLHHSQKSLDLHLATPYFNLPREYICSLAEGLDLRNRHLSIATCAPEANGFFRSKGVSRLIPLAYSAMEREFFKEISGVILDDNERNVKFHQIHRENWTFHGKGIWAYEADQPILTYLSSSNYGQRSVERDLEAGVLIVPLRKNPQMHRLLDHERQGLFEHSLEIDPTLDHQHTPFWLKAVLPFLSRFM